MKVVLVLLLCLLVSIECGRKRRIRYQTDDNDETDENSDSSNINGWFYDTNGSPGQDWYRRIFQGRQPESSSQKYTKLTLDRKMFYYWDSAYDAWTNWTKCDPQTCMTTRNRKCKDDSWQEKVLDFRVEAKCPVQFVSERRKCNDVQECKIENVTVSNNDTNNLTQSCGHRPEFLQTKIFGGRESAKNSWPWHGGLYVIGRYKTPIYICGATLISPGWAVTAAHCLRTLQSVNEVPLGEIIDTRKFNFYNKFQLIFGDHDRSYTDRREKVTKISHFIIHPSFRADFTSNLYDVALLKLDTTIPKQKYIDFACIPESENYTLPKSAKCQAIGWGFVTSQDPFNIFSLEFSRIFDNTYRRRKQNNNRRNANVLQEVDIPLVDFEKCKKVYRIYNLQKDIHLCAGSSRKDTCRGDSGGGLFCLDPKSNQWQLYGITNFGSARGCGKSYGVYVRVAALSAWIRDTLKSVIV